MTRFTIRQAALAFLAAPLALGLAACGGETDDAMMGLSGEPIEKVAPPSGKQWSEVVSKTDAGGYLAGNPDAPIKVVEFGALSCSHCAHFADEASEELFGDFVNSGRVSFELRHFMLNPYDITATLLATCGATEAAIPLSEQFWAWQPKMFENLQGASEAEMQAIDALPPEQRFAALAKVAGIDEFFQARGIAAEQGAACLADSAKVTAMVEATSKASDDYNITGTPSFLINNKLADAKSWAELKAQLEKLGAR